MSTLEDIREDAKREEWERKQELIRPDACKCGAPPESWVCIGTDSAYGADADGRRGVMLREWECAGCGQLESLIGLR